jgi:hypothetical protein
MTTVLLGDESCLELSCWLYSNALNIGRREGYRGSAL